jgi:carboxyl-terminal processing protease
MLPACNRGAGANIHAPDKCATPPLAELIPYVNVALNITSVLFVPTVFVTGLPAHNLLTMLATSSGDEAGSLHWTRMGWSKYVVGNPVVFVGMIPGETLTCPAVGNKANAPRGMCVVPSAVNVVYTSRAAACEAEPLSAEDTGRLLPFVGDASEEVVRSRIEPTSDGRRLVCEIKHLSSAVPVLARSAIARAGDVAELVLDLRGNPGGDLDAAVRVAEFFFPRGSLV